LVGCPVKLFVHTLAPKAVNWGLFHVGHWVLGMRNLVEFSVK
jgi:hypothetical protein